MSSSYAKWMWSGLVLVAVTGAAWEIFADRAQPAQPNPVPAVAVETLLPADTVIYARIDGTKAHAAAWKKTAAAETLQAIDAQGMMLKLLAFFRQQAPGTFTPELEAFGSHVQNHGASLAVSIPKGPPLPRMTLVLHNAAKFETISAELALILSENHIETEPLEIEGRSVRVAHLTKTPAIDLAWWAEGGHLVMAAGVDPVQHTIAVSRGDQPNISQHRLWSKSESNNNRVITSTAWVDAKSLRKKLGGFPILIPQGKPLSITEALEIAGLDTIEELVINNGYEGKTLYSETQLRTKGKRTGLLSVLEGDAISIDDLPPLPVNTNSFLATSINPGSSYETLLRVFREAISHAPKEVAKEAEEVIDALPGNLGFDPKADFLEALGSVLVVCDDPDQGFFGTGSTVIVKVKDAQKLRKTFEGIFAKLSESIPDEFQVHRAKKQGREIWTIELDRMVEGLGIVVDDDWLVIALMPQPVEAFLLRVDGKLPKWSKEQLVQAGAPGLPGKFTSIGVSDPKAVYRGLLKAAPYALTSLVAALKEDDVLPRNAVLPWKLTDIPPAELIGDSLFPNVRSLIVMETGFTWTSRCSLPTLPILGGPGAGNGPAGGAILTGLVLPAIAQSREAARRTASKNNLKQLGLAMHNYHETYKSFPAGTLPNEKLKPEERLSWIAEVLPYLDQAALYKQIDKEGGWEEKGHREIFETRLPDLLIPGVLPTLPNSNYAPTHYVGLTGLGKDAALLPVTSEKAGVFGYNRKTKIRDITDGTSNTVMISEASQDYGAWGSGGTATLRALTKEPYINGPDGIGGPWASGSGCHMLFGDGSVRFISRYIESETLEHLITICGGEVIGDF